MPSPAVLSRTLWTPLRLGSSLAAWWSAQDYSSRMTDDGAGLISSWRDRVTGLAVTATTTARPTYGATSFNSKFPGLTFDGVANCFVTTTLTAIPTGANGSTIVWCGNIVNPGSANGQIVGYGDGVGGTTRQFRQGVAGRYAVSDGTTTSGASASNFNPAIATVDWLGTAENGYLNGSGFSGNPTTIGALNTASTRLRIGANASASPGGFSPLIASDILIVSGVLSTSDRQKMEGYFAWNRGLQSVLPASHPYANQAP